MVHTCCVFNCSKRSKRDNVRFFRIPAVTKHKHREDLNELTLRRQTEWIQVIKRADFTPDKWKNATICSNHFISGKPAELQDTDNLDWGPTQNMGYSSILNSASYKSLLRHKRLSKRRKVLREDLDVGIVVGVKNAVNNPCFLRNSIHSASAMAQQPTVPLTSLLEKLKGFAPLTLAESWDNVGLLIEPQEEMKIGKVLLTIDLTEEVVDEAVTLGTQLIISYHPNIFRPLKQVTQKHWKERIVNKCIRNDIAVFSPHTSWDAVKGGVNDWLASFLSQKSSVPLIVNPNDPSIGMGRLVTLNQPITLQNAIDQVKSHIGLPHLRIGIGKNCDLNSQISTVAICAGSGASVFATTPADLYLTGEMSHHEVLEATQNGINVILCNHSDSERGFLKEFANKFKCDGVQFYVSKSDRDCLTII